MRNKKVSRHRRQELGKLEEAILRSVARARPFWQKAALQQKYATVPEFRCEEEEITLIGTPKRHFGPGAICTSHAEYVATRERGEVCGFFVADNPCEMGRLADGHDFALVDGRFIVDTWLHGWECQLESPVLDLQDPADLPLVQRWYGDPLRWERRPPSAVQSVR